VTYSEKKALGKGSPGNIHLVFGINVIAHLPDQMTLLERLQNVMKLLPIKSWQDKESRPFGRLFLLRVMYKHFNRTNNQL
jgi:hypothetical protein